MLTISSVYKGRRFQGLITTRKRPEYVYLICAGDVTYDKK